MDANLEDEWLDRLNGLRAFDLISVCEGHCNRQAEPSMTPPHIKLRLKEHLLRGIASRWDEHKMAVVGEVNRLFETGDTYVNLELKFKLRSGAGRLTYQEDLVVRIHGRHARTSEEMDDESRHWFQQSVSRAEDLDETVARLWNRTEQDAQ